MTNLPSETEEEPTEKDGYCLYRLKGNPAEQLFHETFAEDKYQCAIDTLISRARGNLLSLEDKRLAATVIQWLGSPVGANFLRDVFEKMGATLIKEPLEEMLTGENEHSRAMGKHLQRLAERKNYQSEIDRDLIELYGME